jgi:dynein heavy chain
MSPVGSLFRERIRMFPSLVNCCTIDWFHAWPSEALHSVANTYLADPEDSESKLRDAPNEQSQDNEIWPDGVREACVEACVAFHTQAEALSKTFVRETRRYNYVTPTSYINLINTFTILRTKKTCGFESDA